MKLSIYEDIYSRRAIDNLKDNLIFILDCDRHQKSFQTEIINLLNELNLAAAKLT